MTTSDDGNVGPWIHVTSSSTVERKHTCDPRVALASDYVGRILLAC